MDIYGLEHRSTAQRTAILVTQTVVGAVALWLLLFGGIGELGRWLGFRPATAPPVRLLLLALFVAVTWARFTLMITVFLKRSIGWQEAISVCFALPLYYIGFALLGGLKPTPFGALDIVAAVLFAAGAVLNTTGELLRSRFKRDPANKGKLYTGGLFRYSRHINYFGDVIWVSAWALLTHNPWAASIPILLFCMFAFFNVPLLDAHLAGKYGVAFEQYRKRTKGLIPFLF